MIQFVCVLICRVFVLFVKYSVVCIIIVNDLKDWNHDLKHQYNQTINFLLFFIWLYKSWKFKKTFYLKWKKKRSRVTQLFLMTDSSTIQKTCTCYNMKHLRQQMWFEPRWSERQQNKYCSTVIVLFISSKMSFCSSGSSTSPYIWCKVSMLSLLSLFFVQDKIMQTLEAGLLSLSQVPSLLSGTQTYRHYFS